MARPRLRPRSAFVITVAAAAVAGACGGSITDDDGANSGGSGGATGGSGGGTVGGSGGASVGGSGGVGLGGSPGGGGFGANPPPIPCPAAAPPEGSKCPSGYWWGTTCSYPDPCGGAQDLIVDCVNESWQLIQGSYTCTDCPTSAPTIGAACAVSSTQMCSYPDGCCQTYFQCNGGKWSTIPVSCNPPPPDCGPTPPSQGAACNPCASMYPCTWDLCSKQGVKTTAICQNGGWSVTSATCSAYDAGPDG